METEAKKCQKFYCSYCNTTCSKKHNWNKHLSTNKHKRNSLIIENKIEAATVDKEFSCNNCSKKYKDKSGLWKHSKKCKKVIEDISNSSKKTQQTNLVLDRKFILDLIKQNEEFKFLIYEQNKRLNEIFNRKNNE
jgi:hypothetical protein